MPAGGNLRRAFLFSRLHQQVTALLSLAVVAVRGVIRGRLIYGVVLSADGFYFPAGEEFRVNTHTAGEQGETGPFTIDASDQGFVVVWQSQLQDGDQGGIFAPLGRLPRCMGERERRRRLIRHRRPALRGGRHSRRRGVSSEYDHRRSPRTARSSCGSRWASEPARPSPSVRRKVLCRSRPSTRSSASQSPWVRQGRPSTVRASRVRSECAC